MLAITLPSKVGFAMWVSPHTCSRMCVGGIFYPDDLQSDSFVSSQDDLFAFGTVVLPEGLAVNYAKAHDLCIQSFHDCGR